MYHRFFVDEEIKENKIINLNSDLLHQFKNVLRFKPTNNFIVINNKKEYLCNFKEETIFILEKIEKKEEEKNNNKIILVQSLIKSKNNNFVIQKTTELGVDEIFFWKSKNSIINTNKEDSKIIRYQKIALEASEQSERLETIKINFINSIKDLKINIKEEIAFVFYAREKSEIIDLKKLELEKFKKIYIFIGPEGGFAKEELEEFKKNNFKFLSLGKNILRSETASIFAVGLISYFSKLK